MRPVIVVHGGAGNIRRRYMDVRREHLEASARVGFDVLVRDGSALEAVVEAVAYMEDSGVFNAGRGSIVSSSGYVELDAAVMDSKGRFGAVGAVPNIVNPVRVAYEVLRRTPHRLLVGIEAKYFALRLGFREMSFDELQGVERALNIIKSRRPPSEYLSRLQNIKKMYGDTVGAVAVDRDGGLAAAVSTGGILFKLDGRVGDSGIFGAGIMVNGLAAAVATGIGEYIIDSMLCYNLVQFRRVYSLSASVRKALNYLTRLRGVGSGGVISVDRWGNVATMHNTKAMGVAYFGEGMESPKVSFNEYIFL